MLPAALPWTAICDVPSIDLWISEPMDTAPSHLQFVATRPLAWCKQTVIYSIGVRISHPSNIVTYPPLCAVARRILFVVLRRMAGGPTGS